MPTGNGLDKALLYVITVLVSGIIGLIVFIYKKAANDLESLHKCVDDRMEEMRERQESNRARLIVLEEGHKHVIYRIDRMTTIQGEQHQENKSALRDISTELRRYSARDKFTGDAG